VSTGTSDGGGLSTQFSSTEKATTTSSRALLEAIERERQRIFRARALAQTAAKLLHELVVPERNGPDLGFVLDVVSDLLEESLAALDRVTLQQLEAGR